MVRGLYYDGYILFRISEKFNTHYYIHLLFVDGAVLLISKHEEHRVE